MKKYLILALTLLSFVAVADEKNTNEDSEKYVKYVMHINYPLSFAGGKQKYLKWVRKNVTKLYAPSKYIIEIRSYDNYYGTQPNRIVEFLFRNMDDATKYWSDERVREVLAEISNYAESASVYTYILRSEYIGDSE